MNKNNLFVRKLDKSMSSKDLDDSFKDLGEIKSAKVALDSSYKSKGYGFVCFQDFQNTLEVLAKSDSFNFAVHAYAPKDRREIRKIFNNIYVKNFPVSWDEEKLREVFSQFGHITSIFKQQAEKDGVPSVFAFVCYGSENMDDNEAGPKSAAAAVAALHETVHDGMKIYVKDALKKTERQQEKLKEMLRYKNSKKRCNLFVKNFPPTTT